MALTKADIVSSISGKTGIVRKDVALAVDAFLESVIDSLKEGKHIEIRGFGTFKLKERKSRIGRNPKTDEKVEVPARIVPTFKFSRAFKEEVNGANQDKLK